jgi:hypothetical protein
VTDLPDPLQRIADELGEAAMLKVAQAFGGERVHIPTTVRPGSRLAKELGADLAQKVADVLGGGWEITVPLGPAAGEARMRRAIAKLLREGLSTNEIVRRLRCHEVTVRRMRSRLKLGGDARQADMFDKRT